MNRIIFAVLLLFIGQLSAQNKYILSGLVIDEYKKTVPYAIINDISNGVNVQSDIDGLFLLEVNPKEQVKIRISSMGYEIEDFEFTVSHDNENLTFKLRESTFHLNELVVNGNNRSNAHMKSSQNIVRVDKGYIENNFSGSLMQSLESLPGIRAMSIGSSQSKPAIRGMGFNRMIVAENGVKHEGQQWGDDHGLEIDQFSIDEIDIIKGPSSLLYGSDAIGGIVSIRNNFVPKDGFNGKVNLFTRSNNESLGFHTQIGGKKKRFYYRANLTLVDYADYKVPTDSIQYYSYYIRLKDRRLRNTAGNEKNGGVMIGYSWSNFTTNLQISNVYSQSGFFADAHGLEVRLSDINYDQSRRDVDLPYHSVNHFKVVNNSTWKINKISIESNLSFQNNLRKEFSEAVSHGYMPIPTDSLEREFDKNIYTANIQMKYLWTDKHSINVGINTEYQQNERGGWGFIIPDFETYSFGVHALNRYHISEDLIITGGVRFDRVNTQIHRYNDWYKTPVENSDSIYKERSSDLKRLFSSLSWGLGVNYNIGQWNLKANIGKSFRVPTPKETGSNGVNYHIFRYEKGDPNLLPEESYQLDAGIYWNNNKISFQLSPYFNYFPNYIYLNPTASYYEGLQMYYYTQSKVVRYGFEAELNYKLSSHLVLDVNSEYLYARQLSGDKEGYTLPFSPPWSGDIGLKYTPPAKWIARDGFISLSYKVVGSQNQIVPPERITKGFQTLNAALTNSFLWNNNSVRVSLQARNLLNKRYYDHTSFYRLIDVPESGRNFSLMVGIDF